MRKIISWLIIICSISLVGCNKEPEAETVQWYETKEEAIKYGLQQEGTSETAVLSIEDYKGETIVFYEGTYASDIALGVASITESEKGFSWYRNRPYFGVEGESTYTTSGITTTTKSGVEVSILAGKAFDPSIEKMRLTENGQERDLQIHEKSRFYFSIHDAPFESIDVIPIQKK